MKDLREPREEELKEIEENGIEDFGEEISTAKEAEELARLVLGVKA